VCILSCLGSVCDVVLGAVWLVWWVGGCGCGWGGGGVCFFLVGWVGGGGGGGGGGDFYFTPSSTDLELTLIVFVSCHVWLTSCMY